MTRCPAPIPPTQPHPGLAELQSLWPLNVEWAMWMVISAGFECVTTLLATFDQLTWRQVAVADWQITGSAAAIYLLIWPRVRRRIVRHEVARMEAGK